MEGKKQGNSEEKKGMKLKKIYIALLNCNCVLRKLWKMYMGKIGRAKKTETTEDMWANAEKTLSLVRGHLRSYSYGGSLQISFLKFPIGSTMKPVKGLSCIIILAREKDYESNDTHNQWIMNHKLLLLLNEKQEGR